MRNFAGSLCSLGLGFSAFCHAVLADSNPEQSSRDAVVFRTSAASGEQHFAVAIRSSAVPVEIKRHVVLVDTSASQTGRFRADSSQLLAALIARLPEGHTVMVAAVDSSLEPLTAGFEKSGSQELIDVVQKLAKRTPMGATNLPSVLRESLVEKSNAPTSVLYIGDGMSPGDLMSVDDLNNLVTDLASRSISFHAVLLGPKVDPQLTGILANQTGGTLECFQHSGMESSSQRLVAQLSAAPELVKDLDIDGAGLKLATFSTVALRADRDTILFGEGSPSGSAKISGVSEHGETLVWSADPAKIRTAGEEVRLLFERAEQSGGLNSAVVGVDGLTNESRQFESTIVRSIANAERLKQRGQTEQAIEVTRQAQLLDASNPILTAMMASLTDETESGSGNDEVGPPAVDDGDPLRKSEARNEILTQQLVQSTNAAVAEANRVASEQPEYALTLLKDLLEAIRSSTDVAPEKRDELERRVINAYSRVNQTRQTIEIANRASSQRRANQEAQKNLLEEAQLEEERLNTLIAQVRGLLDRARHGDSAAFEEAEIAARTAIDMKPGNGTASAAVVMAEGSGQLSKAYELRNLRADRFLETLYQVELSHVPFPDEPPIQYPPADVWRALSLARKEKYESVSLRSEKPVELWLEKMLDEPIPQLDFGVNTSLREVLDALETHYNLTGEYNMRIILDESDPDIGEDPEYLDTTQVSNVTFKGITLRNALKLILAKVKDQELTFMIKNEVMMITTVATAESEENLITRVYQVADLVVQTIAQQGGGFGGGQQGGQQGGFGGGQQGGQQGGFGGGGGQFTIPPEDLSPADQGINLKADSIKKKPAK